MLCADTLLQLAVSVLGMETIVVSLLDGNQKYMLAATGFVTPGMSMEPPAICHWSLVPSLHQMVVVEDTLEDARQDPCSPGQMHGACIAVAHTNPDCRAGSHR